MKIKVGQYVRRKNGIIDKVLDIIKDDKLGEYLHCGHRGIFDYKLKDLKVANTPQELIEVGDLVSINEWTFIVTYINNGIINGDAQLNIKTTKITKIYTPNKDKSVYTLQYSKE